MRKSRAETAETRRRILAAAADAFRRNGIRGTGLADIMAAVGLTQGGFYRHFKSKDQLVAEACAADVSRAAEAICTADESSISNLLDRCFSPDPEANPLQACPLVALGSELVRADDQARAAASDALFKLAAELARQSSDPEPAAAREQALFLACSIVGTLTMSRLVPDPAVAAAILRTGRKWLAGTLSKGAETC